MPKKLKCAREGLSIYRGTRYLNEMIDATGGVRTNQNSSGLTWYTLRSIPFKTFDSISEALKAWLTANFIMTEYAINRAVENVMESRGYCSIAPEKRDLYFVLGQGEIYNTFSTQLEAQNDAERLAKSRPGEAFVVAKGLTESSTNQVVTKAI